MRNRRATTVQEVSDSESEQISTRIVANYNHMHALTVQYWEVVQTYRVQVELERYTRALFVPLEPLDFDDDTVIDRFRFVMARVALTRPTREQLLERPAVTELRPALAAVAIDPGFFRLRSRRAGARVFRSRAGPSDQRNHRPARRARNHATGGHCSQYQQPLPPARMRSELMRGGTLAPTADNVANIPAEALADLGGGRPALAGETLGVWNLPQIEAVAQFFNQPIVTSNGTALEAPRDAMLEAIDLDGFGTDIVEIITNGGNIELATNGGSVARLDSGVPLSTVQRIAVRRSRRRMNGTVNLRLRVRGSQVVYPFPASVSAGNGNATVVSANNAAGPQFNDELKTHLKANRLHYSRAVYESLDPAQISALLAGFTYEGKPLLAGVEPRPYAIAGNYIVLRAPTDEDETVNGQNVRSSWGELVDQFRLGDVGDNDPRLILPALRRRVC